MSAPQCFSPTHSPSAVGVAASEYLLSLLLPIRKRGAAPASPGLDLGLTPNIGWLACEATRRRLPLLPHSPERELHEDSAITCFSYSPRPAADPYSAIHPCTHLYARTHARTYPSTPTPTRMEWLGYRWVESAVGWSMCVVVVWGGGGEVCDPFLRSPPSLPCCLTWCCVSQNPRCATNLAHADIPDLTALGDRGGQRLHAWVTLPANQSGSRRGRSAANSMVASSIGLPAALVAARSGPSQSARGGRLSLARTIPPPPSLLATRGALRPLAQRGPAPVRAGPEDLVKSTVGKPKFVSKSIDETIDDALDEDNNAPETEPEWNLKYLYDGGCTVCLSLVRAALSPASRLLSVL